MKTMTGVEVVTDGVPKGWVIVGREPDRDVYILEEDTPIRLALRKLAEIERLTSEALDALNGVTDEGHW